MKDYQTIFLANFYSINYNKNMRNIFFISFLFLFLTPLFSKTTPKKDIIGISNWERMASNCISIRDWNGFITANNMLSIINPDKDTLYKKNILFAYSENNQSESCFLLSKQLIEQYKQDKTFLLFYAQSAEKLNRFGDASIGYEKLYVFTNSPTYGYLLANAQYYLGRYAESLQTIGTLKLNKECANEFLDFTLINSDKKQSVPISAALYNLEGMSYYEMKNMEGCKISFQKAIYVFPAFDVAKENLKGLLSNNQKP
jgi:tetratricopeptide (TPR) repeat protein